MRSVFVDGLLRYHEGSFPQLPDAEAIIRAARDRAAEVVLAAGFAPLAQPRWPERAQTA